MTIFKQLQPGIQNGRHKKSVSTNLKKCLFKKVKCLKKCLFKKVKCWRLTGWSQDQGPLMWALVLASICLQLYKIPKYQYSDWYRLISSLSAGVFWLKYKHQVSYQKSAMPYQPVSTDRSQLSLQLQREFRLQIKVSVIKKPFFVSKFYGRMKIRADLVFPWNMNSVM